MRRRYIALLVTSLPIASATLGAQIVRIPSPSAAAARPGTTTPAGAAAAPSANPASPAAPPAATKPKGAVGRAVAARAEQRNSVRYDATFEKYSKRFFGPGFDWQFFKAQAIAESELNAGAVSPVGARGLMQLMPSTFALIQSARPEYTSIDDPEFNIAAGIMHDRYLWRLWGDKNIPEAQRPYFMFGSYNAGEGTIGNAIKVAQSQKLESSAWPSIELVAPTVPRWRYRETIGYVRKIDSVHTRFTKPPE